MSIINVILSLNPVGQQEPTADSWNFCLRLSAGYDAEASASDDRQKLATTLLPWYLFQSKGLKAFVVDATGAIPAGFAPLDLKVDPPDHFPDPPAPLAAKGFSSYLRDDIKTQLSKLITNDTAQALGFQWMPSDNPSVVSNTNTSNPKLSLPGLLKTLAALPPDLSQALRAAWYFKISRIWLKSFPTTNPPLRLLVTPSNLFDFRTNSKFTLPVTSPVIKPVGSNGSVFTIYYGDTAGPTATGYALQISNLPGSMPYWLKVTDGRGKTVSDIDQKIGQCLDYINRVAYVKVEDLANALTIKPNDQNKPIPTNLEIARYLLANAPVDDPDWKRPDPSQADYTTVLQQRQQAIATFLNQLSNIPAGSDPVEWLEQQANLAIKAWWTFHWPTEKANGTGQWLLDLLRTASKKGLIANLDNLLSIDLKNASTLANALTNSVFTSSRDDASPSPTLPNEGFDLQLGDLDKLLLHADACDNDSDEAQVASAGLLVRRATAQANLSTSPWQLVTAGIPVVDPNQILSGSPGNPAQPFGSQTLAGKPEVPNAGEPLPGGFSLDFVNNIRRSEVTYRGENPRLQSPVAFVHRQTGQNATPDKTQLLAKPRLSTFSFQLPGSLGKMIPNVASTLVPPLRYGDFYEFYSFVLDRTFGLPEKLSETTVTTTGPDGIDPGFNWEALGTFVPDPEYSSGSLQFLRRVPVGEINILPPEPGWPTVPTDVNLRAPQWFKNFLQLKAPTGSGRINNNTAPMLLLVPSDNRFLPTAKTGLSDNYTFNIEPPRIDEFTLSRWRMPAVGSGDDGSQLKSGLKRIFRERDDLLAGSAFVAFRNGDIYDLKGLRGDFTAASLAPVPKYLWGLFSDETKQLFKTGSDQDLLSGLVIELNRLCSLSTLFNKSIFPINTLPDEIQSLVNTPLADDAMKRFNRILLESGLPERICISWANRAPLNQSSGAKILPHEQAVTAYGIYCHYYFADNNGSEKSLMVPVVVPSSPADAAPYNVKSLPVSVQFTPTAPVDSKDLVQTTPGSVTILVPEGWFCGIAVAPLVSNADYKRFDPVAMAGLCQPGTTPVDNQYHAFESSWILAESVTTKLPSPASLYEGFSASLDSPTGDIRLTLQKTGNPITNLAFVDTFTISRQRWFWRNRPLLDPTLSPPDPINDEWQRLAAGGLPAGLFNPGLDTAADVLPFDAIAGMDGGLLDRASFVGRLPRSPSGAPLSGNILLLVDDRDAISAADYLRYGLIVKSRYASLITDSNNQQVTASTGVPNDYETDPTWRRIVASYRGDLTQIKPLKIFAILPLTKLPQATPFGIPNPGDPTPFLVMIDEVWFREYGQGERLEAYLAIEDSDMIENPSSTATTSPPSSDPRPLRVAPLPDHYVTPASPGTNYYNFNNKDGLAETETDNNNNPLVSLNVFGPFGYTLDQSDNQALANATAYIVYPPKDVGPNWWMGVRLRRRLDKIWDPDKAQYNLTKRSLPSDVRHFYTRPADFISGAQNVDSKLILHTSNESVELVNLQLQIQPIFPYDAVAAGQYASVLILGNTVADGGLGQEIFVPSTACWLTTNENDRTELQWTVFGNGPLPATAATAGRIMLLMLNGTHLGEDGTPFNPLQGPEVTTLTDLLKILLPAPSEPSGALDCQAMVVGLSDQFNLSIEK
jgi:hypothetical protein